MAGKQRTREDAELAQGALSSAPRWRWYHGVLFYIAVQVMTFSLAGLVSTLRGNRITKLRDFFGDVDYFRQLHQAKITPPSWAFGPAWTLNNFCTIAGLLRVLNQPANLRGRNAYLALQGVSWLNFVLFNAAYFSLRSPLNALALTFSMFVLTIASGLVALFRLKDTWVALSLATLFLWLTIALTAAAFQVAWNHDEFYHIGPFFQRQPALEKATSKQTRESRVGWT